MAASCTKEAKRILPVNVGTARRMRVIGMAGASLQACGPGFGEGTTIHRLCVKHHVARCVEGVYCCTLLDMSTIYPSDLSDAEWNCV
jgi:hypothetical protein